MEKKEYSKPEVEMFEFETDENIMDGSPVGDPDKEEIVIIPGSNN